MGEELYRGMKIGKYEILTQLTSGGMAELFLGYTAGPGGFRKYVVVKRILPDAKDNEQFLKMFLDEARITAAFNHPNIAQVFDLGEDAAGPYLAMEFIAGQNLNQVTSACARKRAVMPIGFSAAVVHDLGLALHYAHTFTDPAGKHFPVIHRDVAQKNVMVTYGGGVKLLDFGIAKARGSLGRTNVGTVKGTTGYMSPEQVKGEPLDGRSDVFSLGVVLWEMVTGRRLFSGDTEIDEMKMILTAPIGRPSELVPVIPETLSDITLRALAREKADRFPTAKDFSRALQLACPELLFDQEQRATFMAEMFEEKVAATQALLESAGGEMEKAAVLNAVSLLREDAGSSFPEVSGPNKPAGPAKNRKRAVHVPPKRRATADDLDQKQLEQAVAIARLAGPEPQVPKTNPQGTSEAAEAVGSSLKGNLVLLMIAVLTAMGGFAVYKFIWNVSTTTADPGYGSEVPIPGQVDPTVPGPPPAVPLAPVDPLAPPVKPGTAPKTAAPVDPPKAAARQGMLTLVVFPDANVYRGGKLLGKTPLFAVPLPAGTHLLTLIGEDKAKHSFSVVIQPNKTVSFKLQLAELPPG